MVIQAGFARSDHDSTMFVSVSPRGRAILLFYVDDMKLTGDYSVTISLIKCRLPQLFAMKDEVPPTRSAQRLGRSIFEEKTSTKQTSLACQLPDWKKSLPT